MQPLQFEIPALQNYSTYLCRTMMQSNTNVKYGHCLIVQLRAYRKAARTQSA